jgi:RNA polymerase sigma-70 factor, ECF subfamily
VPRRPTDRGLVRMTLASIGDGSFARASAPRRGNRGDATLTSMNDTTEVRLPERSVTSEGSADLHRDLLTAGPQREGAITRLHALLLKVARGEANRRRAHVPERVRDELDDLCVQATNDALMTILRKLDEFRGASRFTTWTCKFVIFEVSTRLRRHAWRHKAHGSESTVWNGLADASPSAQYQLEQQELAAVLVQAVQQRLTPHQRSVFEAIVMHETPIDVVAERAGSSRGAIYKTLHDARRRLRVALAESGHSEQTRLYE